MPERLPAVEYDSSDTVRKVQHSGWISYQGREWRISKALHGFALAIRGTEVDGDMAVYFCRQRVAVLELRTGRVRHERG